VDPTSRTASTCALVANSSATDAATSRCRSERPIRARWTRRQFGASPPATAVPPAALTPATTRRRRTRSARTRRPVRR
jgi:hypothetical protein